MRYIVVLLYVFLMVGCAKTVYVPREEVKVEYRDRVRYDPIFERDSIFVREKGDTVYIYQDRWRDRYYLLRDTFL